jgi:DNA-binding transcriptional LysR family regulator
MISPFDPGGHVRMARVDTAVNCLHERNEQYAVPRPRTARYNSLAGQWNEPMNFDRIDLNLLRVFDVVFEERNLVRAARRLHLSQSAISHALARLRSSVDDDLFVRTASGMQPTPRALAIAGPLRNALRQIGSALGGAPFAPATTDREFVIAASDYITMLLMGRLSGELQLDAPCADLVIRPSTRIDLAGQIDLGRIDVAIGAFAEIPARFRSMPLWTQVDRLAMRRGHPLAARAPARQDLLDYPLLAVSLGGAEEGAVDGYISERGLARQSDMFDRQALYDALAPDSPRLRMLVAHALAVPSLLGSSDMLALLPSPLAAVFARDHGLVCASLPYPPRPVEVRAVWHERSDADPAHTWMRARLAQLGRNIVL